jgi:hypothetical protein
MGSAPPGLSRDEFFALIDRELQGQRLETVTDEPDTWIGGFLQSIVTGGKPGGIPGVRKELLESGMLDSAAQPESLGDFLQLLVPQGVNRGVNLGQEIINSGAARARQAQPGMLNRVRGFWRGALEDINPPSMKDTRRLMGLDGQPVGPTTTQIGGGGQDLYDVYKGNRPSRLPYDTPNPLERRQSDVGPPVGTRERRTIFEEGQQSGSQAAQETAERMRPSDRAVPVERVDELAGKFGGQQPTDALLEELSRIEGAPSHMRGGAAPRVVSLKPDKMSPEQWAEARRYYGADKLADLTGLTREQVLQRAPGPSRVPLEIENLLMDDPKGVFRYPR